MWQRTVMAEESLKIKASGLLQPFGAAGAELVWNPVQQVLPLTLLAFGVKGSRMDDAAATVFSLSRILTLSGLSKPGRLARGVELSTAVMRAAFALRLTTEGLMLLRSVKAEAFLDFGVTPDLLALGPVATEQYSGAVVVQSFGRSGSTRH